MQLAADTDIDRAIVELQRALPICALQNIIAERKRQNREVGTLRRRLQVMKARQIVAEASVD